MRTNQPRLAKFRLRGSSAVIICHTRAEVEVKIYTSQLLFYLRLFRQVDTYSRCGFRQKFGESKEGFAPATLLFSETKDYNERFTSFLRRMTVGKSVTRAGGSSISGAGCLLEPYICITRHCIL